MRQAKLITTITERESKQKKETPFKVVLEEFCKLCNLRNLAVKTINGYSEVLQKFFSFLSNKKRIFYIEDITSEYFEEYTLSLVTKSPAYAKRFIKYWNCFCVRIYDKYKIENYKRSVPYIKVPKTIIKCFSDEDIVNMINVLDINDYYGYRTYVMIILMVQCGLRVDETLNLKVTNILLKENKIDIKHSKGMKERIVPMNKELAQLLANFIYVRNNGTELIENDYLFLDKFNQKMTYNSLRQYFKKHIITKVKLSEGRTFGFHNFRRKYATDFMKKINNLSELQYLLGHEDVSTTSKYVKLSSSDFDEKDYTPNSFILK